MQYRIVVESTVLGGLNKYGIEIDGHGSSFTGAAVFDTNTEEGYLFVLLGGDVAPFYSFWKEFLGATMVSLDLKPIFLPNETIRFVVFRKIKTWPFENPNGPSAEEVRNSLLSALGKIRAE